MENKIIETKILTTSEHDIKTAAEIIRGGGLAAFPTETVYGLGASAYDEDAAKKIYAAKGRPSDNPLIVHVASAEQIKDVALEIPKSAARVIEKFMPGPITIILKKKDTIPDTVTAGLAP